MVRYGIQNTGRAWVAVFRPSWPGQPIGPGVAKGAGPEHWPVRRYRVNVEPDRRGLFGLAVQVGDNRWEWPLIG